MNNIHQIMFQPLKPWDSSKLTGAQLLVGVNCSCSKKGEGESVQGSTSQSLGGLLLARRICREDCLTEWHWPMTPTSLHRHILQAVKSMSKTRGEEVVAERERIWREEEEEEEGCCAECPWRRGQSAWICEWIKMIDSWVSQSLWLENCLFSASFVVIN